MRILLADDILAIRLLTKKILTDQLPCGIIEEVTDGLELVHHIVDHAFDIVITDISMPGMNGLDAIVEIRRLSFMLPILVLSSHASEAYIQMALKAGASGYVHKYKIHEDLVPAIGGVM